MNQAQPTTIQIAKRKTELQKRRTKKGSRSKTSKSQETKNGRREEEEIKPYLSRSPSLQSLIEIWDFLLDLSRRQQPRRRRRRRLQKLSLRPQSPIVVVARRYQVRSNPLAPTLPLLPPAVQIEILKRGTSSSFWHLRVAETTSFHLCIRQNDSVSLFIFKKKKYKIKTTSFRCIRNQNDAVLNPRSAKRRRFDMHNFF